jgi:hypothetical protein
MVERGDMKRAMEICEAWGARCGASRLYSLTKAVLMMKTGQSLSTENPALFMDQLLDAPLDPVRLKSTSRPYDVWTPYSEYTSDEERALYLFLYGQCLGIKSQPGTLEHFTCLMMTGQREKALRELRRTSLRETPLYDHYAMRRKDLFNTSGMHMALRAGIWQGEGATSRIGNLPLLGLSVGGNFRNGDLMDATVESMVGGNPAQPVQIAFLDSVLTTDFASGLYVGLEYDKVLWRSRDFHHRIGLRGGVGYSHLNLVQERYRGEVNTNNNNSNNTSNTDQRDQRKIISSIAASAALSYAYYLTPAVYINAMGKYYLHDYRNTGGTDIRGSSWTATIGFGFIMGTNSVVERRKLGLTL